MVAASFIDTSLVVYFTPATRHIAHHLQRPQHSDPHTSKIMPPHQISSPSPSPSPLPTSLANTFVSTSSVAAVVVNQPLSINSTANQIHGLVNLTYSILTNKSMPFVSISSSPLLSLPLKANVVLGLRAIPSWIPILEHAMH